MLKDPVRQNLKKKEQAYRAIFRGQSGTVNEAAKTVLADLRVFCNGTKSCFNSDPLVMARNAARQEVFQRIMNFLEVDYSDFYKLEDDFD